MAITPYNLAREIVRELEGRGDVFDRVEEDDGTLFVDFTNDAVDLIADRIMNALRDGGIKSHD